MKRIVLLLIGCFWPTALIAQTQSEAPRLEGHAVLAGFGEFDFQTVFDVPRANTSSLRTMGELELRRSRIGVDSTAVAYLIFGCIGYESQDIPVVSFSCRLYVRLPVLQNYPTDRVVMADVWEVPPQIGIVGVNKIDSALRSALESMFPTFLNEWHRANPER